MKPQGAGHPAGRWFSRCRAKTQGPSTPLRSGRDDRVNCFAPVGMTKLEARLPDGHRLRDPPLGQACPLQKAQGAGHSLSTSGHDSLRKPLLNALHRSRRRSDLGLAHEQMKVLRHDDVSQNNQAMLFAHFFENVQKQITALVGVEPRLSLIATAGDEVQISGAVVTP
jgi:hypothetical protein